MFASHIATGYFLTCSIDQPAASGAKLPVIFMTAHDHPEWRERAAKLNTLAYLRKPFDQQSLLDAIHLVGL